MSSTGTSRNGSGSSGSTTSTTTTTTTNNNNAQHTLCIEGLPSNYTWQDVKDLARNRAEHGIRANIVERAGINGDKIIICFVNVSRRNEAVNLYEWLISKRIEGRYLIVHLFDDTGSCFQANCHLSDLACVVCRPPQPAHSTSGYAPMMQHSAFPHHIAMRTPSSGMPSYNTIPPTPSLSPLHPPPAAAAQQYRLPPSLASRPDGPRLHAAAIALRSRAAAGVALDAAQQDFLRVMDQLSLQDMRQMDAPTAAVAPVYAAAASGAMINTSNGYARTEVRGVFVQGLDFKTRQKDVEALFSRAGEVTRCEVHVNSHGKPKGTATIQFATAAEARHAVQSLDQFKWKGRVLRVRSDREAVVTEAPATRSSATTIAQSSTTTDVTSQEPTIVDGSNSRQARRDSKVSSTK